MKKLAIISLILGLAALTALAAFTYVPIYSIVGQVNDIPEAAANGQMIVFYKDVPSYDLGQYNYGYINSGGMYLINATSNPLMPLLGVGETYNVAVVRNAAGYGAGPETVTISGLGYDIAPDMIMALGAGIHPPGGTSILPPTIAQVWFDNRIYQKTLVEQGEQFIVDTNPEIRAEIEAVGGHGIDTTNLSIVINEGGTAAKTYDLTAANIVNTVYAQDAPDKIQSLSVKFSIPDSEPLPTDADTKITVRAFDSTSAVATSEVCQVTVLGGPLRVVGGVIFYPSPFSIRRDGTATIQYTLSQDTNVDIYIYAASGQIVKKFFLTAGSDGGNTGVNKVTWDGRTETGMLAGNGVFVGTLVSRDEKKLLARFKFSILD